MAMTDHPRIAKPRIVVTAKLLDSVEARMAELFDVRFNPDDHAFSRDELAEAMADCDVLVPTVSDRIDADLLKGAPDRLKMIANFGAGVDHIDLAAAQARRITVPRRLNEGEKLVRSGAWNGWRPSGMLGHRVGGKTLGIIGFGRIGEAVARRARAFGLNILYNKRRRLPPMLEEELGVTYEPDLDRLVARSDIVSLHAPLTEETRGLIDAGRLSAMKPTAYLINTSRGELVDENALIEALETGRIGGAGLDVYTHEPAVDGRLLALDNVVLLPHLGSATFEGREASGERVIANIRIWADGHRPPDQVLTGLA
jgi:glyoxylate reductase